MSNNYGLVYTASQAKQQLLNQNRDYNNRLTWQSMLNANSQAARRAEDQLIKQYTDASVEAYTSYLQNQSAIKNSQVVGQSKDVLLNENEQTLLEIYNSYKQSLNDGMGDIATAETQGAENINTLLEEQAQMTADYTNAHYSYLQALYDKYLAGENDYFNEGNQWNKYTTFDQLKDENGNPVYDENGQPVLDETSPRLMNWDELSNPQYGFYNADGTLTLKGVDFFDQLENQIANEGEGYSWGQYLTETNPELAEWANSYNPYNYTQDGTNAGTMRTMYGMMSTDDMYSFAERFGGLNEQQINDMYSSYTEASQELADAITSSGKDSGKSQIQAVSNYVNNIGEMADELGIKQDIEKELGMPFEQLSDEIDILINQSKDSGEMAADWFARFGAYTAGFAVAGASLGTSFAGVGAGIGAALGAILGAIGGIIDASIKTDEQRNLNKSLAEQSQQMYQNLLNTMVAYSQSKRRQAEIDFNNANIY